MASDTQGLWGSLFKAMNSGCLCGSVSGLPISLGPGDLSQSDPCYPSSAPSSKKAQGPQSCGRKGGRVYATGDMPSHPPRVCLLKHRSPRTSFTGCPRKSLGKQKHNYKTPTQR